MNMNKIHLITVCLCAALLIAIFSFFLFDALNSDYERKAPTNTSVWIGDVDFGCWYDISEVDSINYVARIKIYHDYDTGIWNEAYYRNSSKSVTPFSKQNILKSILDYDINNGNIALKLANDSLVVLRNRIFE